MSGTKATLASLKEKWTQAQAVQWIKLAFHTCMLRYFSEPEDQYSGGTCLGWTLKVRWITLFLKERIRAATAGPPSASSDSTVKRWRRCFGAMGVDIAAIMFSVIGLPAYLLQFSNYSCQENADIIYLHFIVEGTLQVVK